VDRPAWKDHPVVAIRPARHEDLAAMQRVERAAGEPFRELGMDAVADDEPPPIGHLAQYEQAGRAWVAVHDGEVVAYLVVDVVADAAHIEQVSVDPRHGRQRIGRDLVETAAAWASRHGLTTLTLTAFTDVPWNAPYYRRLGFTALTEHELSPELAAIRDAERARGLDRWPRCAMLRRLD
jgi:GNAT superfamily N-acetyltransferase